MAAFLAKKANNENIVQDELESIDYMTAHIPTINIVRKVQKTATVYDATRCSTMLAKPRPAPKHLGDQGKRKEGWEFKLSCFKEYKPDNEARLV